jgi:cystathionine beta-lyase/cystathionine gamma-synthase
MKNVPMRFSIGIEHITDLLADLDRAFACVASK